MVCNCLNRQNLNMSSFKRKDERGKRKDERGKRKEERGKRKGERGKGKEEREIAFGILIFKADI